MDSPASKLVGRAVKDFLDHLYQLPTMAHAINHSCMESWIALEGLEFFAANGWKCWETLGFITEKPVRRPTDGAGIKFPDLVCVKDGISVWWEFKGVSALALHPKAAAGTFAEDLLALANFNGKKTRQYLTTGKRDGVRPRSDLNNIKASGLKEELGVGRNWGVAMLFTPAPGQVNWISGAIDRVTERVDGLEVPPSTITALKWNIPKPADADTALTEKRWPKSSSHPDWHAWMVDMGVA